MALSNTITGSGILMRFIFAYVLVFATYNPYDSTILSTI